MSGSSLKDYTVKRVGSSAGASGTGSTLPWIQGQLITSGEGRRNLTVATVGVPGSVHVTFHVGESTGGVLWDEFPSVRLLSHLVLAALPEVAVREAFESLADLYTFHDPTPQVGVGEVTLERVIGGRVAESRRAEPVFIPEG